MNTIAQLIELTKPKPRPTKPGWWTHWTLGIPHNLHYTAEDIKYSKSRVRKGAYWRTPGQEK